MPMNAASIAGKDTRFVNSCTLKWCASRISAEFYGSGELFGLILAHRERLERLDGKHNVLTWCAIWHLSSRGTANLGKAIPVGVGRRPWAPWCSQQTWVCCDDEPVRQPLCRFSVPLLLRPLISLMSVHRPFRTHGPTSVAHPRAGYRHSRRTGTRAGGRWSSARAWHQFLGESWTRPSTFARAAQHRSGWQAKRRSNITSSPSRWRLQAGRKA